MIINQHTIVGKEHFFTLYLLFWWFYLYNETEVIPLCVERSIHGKFMWRSQINQMLAYLETGCHYFPIRMFEKHVSPLYRFVGLSLFLTNVNECGCFYNCNTVETSRKSLLNFNGMLRTCTGFNCIFLFFLNAKLYRDSSLNELE